MKPLRVALVHRAGENTRTRTYGPWSYPVPEFEVEHFEAHKGFEFKRSEFAGMFDLIFYEDGKLYGTFWTDADIPLVYNVTDSTLSEELYQIRLGQAKQADLITVDWDKLERFDGLGKPVRRLSYCVNDTLCKDYGLEKTVDVGMYMTFDAERRELLEQVKEFCKSKGYSLAASSKLRGEGYAKAFNQTKVCLNFSRTPETRNHRVLDVMASRSCLLTTPLPYVTGEDLRPGRSFEVFTDGIDGLEKAIESLLSTGDWGRIADAGYEMIHKYHTWAVRALWLRTLLLHEFPQLRKAVA